MEVGRVSAIYRYPVKSMAGEQLPASEIGWHGVHGDRRLAFLRRNLDVSFPWLTASKLPSLISYRPLRNEGEGLDVLPSLVDTPDGRRLDLRSEELKRELSEKHGMDVELVRVDNGIFDDAPVSVITTRTVDAIGDHAGMGKLDARRFRPNIVIDGAAAPFSEKEWIGRTLRIGEESRGVTLSIYINDVRCAMVNLDPDTAVSDPRVLKATVKANDNCAGVYCSVLRAGTIEVGDVVTLI